MLGPSLSKTWILLDFKIHQDFIVQVLCINKDEPAVMCNGNCYLTQQLANQEQKEDTPFAAAKKFELTYTLEELDTYKFASVLYQPACIAFHRGEIVSSFLDEVFHPPNWPAA